MDIDPDIANWILEFVLLQPLEYRALKSLLQALPLPNDNFNLKKLLMWKKLEFEASTGSISESTLAHIEQLEEIEFRQGNETVSDAMKRAYCMVAVECTVKHLSSPDDGDYNSKFEYFEAVKRIWRWRVGRMEKMVEKGGLVSQELRAWKDEIEAALWDDTVCESVMKKKNGVNAVDAIRAFVRGEREKMGPSFLEVLAARLKDEDLQKILKVGRDDLEVNQATTTEAMATEAGDFSTGGTKLRKTLVGFGDEYSKIDKIVDPDGTALRPSHSCNSPSSEEVNGVSGSVKLQAIARVPLPESLQLTKAVSHAARENESHDLGAEKMRVDLGAGKEAANHVNQAAVTEAKATEAGNVGTEMQKGRTKLRKKLVGFGHEKSKRAKIVDADGTALGPSHRSCDSPIREEVNTVSGAVKLQTIVKDPLPDSLQLTKAISDAARKNEYHDPVKENNPEASSSAGIVHAVKENNLEANSRARIVHSVSGSVSNVHRPSLMEPNSSARIYEWDESQEDPTCKGSRLLSTIKTINVSPINRHEVKSMKTRRKPRKWSIQEEDNLRKGVEKYGVGNWKVILTENRDMFEDRTEVDLKDKWRNLTRYKN